MCYAKPGPRCSRHAADALKAALASGDEQAIKDAKRDFALTPRGIAALKAKGETEAAEWCQHRRDQMVAAYTERLKVDELNKELNDRLSSEEFAELLQTRDAARENYERLDKELTELRENPDATFEQIKAKNNEVREAYFANLDAKDNYEEYRNETAHIVARIADSSQMFETEFTGSRLGTAEPMESYPSNSREWLMQRQQGIGGSDVGAILKVDPKWGKGNFDRVLEDKSKDYASMDDSEFHVTEQNENRKIENAMQRGDAWEPVVANIFAAHNPDLKVMHTKTTWRSIEDPDMIANFDGILSSREDGEPDGILEIKTSSNKEDWENGVPDGYRAQVLHYLDVTGLDYAYVAVQIDDKEYRQYRIERGEKINNKVGTVAENKEKLKNFLARAKRIRAGEEPISSPRSRDAHPLITYTNSSHSAEKLLAAYTGRSEEDIQREVRANNSHEDYDAAVRAVFRNAKMGDQDKVSVDLETTGFGVSTSEIIEVGWTRRNKDGEVVSKGSMMFSPDPRFMRSKGTGRDDVHNIHPEDVAGRPQFIADKESQRKIMEAFQGATIVAHNADFERRFLEQNLDGFRESNPQFLDTMLLSRYFETETDGNTLEKFTEANGVEYKDAHRAYEDANMTVEALFNFAKKNGHI